MTIDKLNLTPALQFYQKNDKKIILAIVLVLALYLIAFAAKLTWQLIPEPEAAVSSSQTTTHTTTTAMPANTKTKLNQLLNLNLFGDASAKPQLAVQRDVTDAPETKLNLILAGVVASSTPSAGAAVIEYRNNQNTYGIGDKIEGTQVTLDKIYADRVIIKNRVARETLMLEGIDFDEANKLREQNQAINGDNRQTAGRGQASPVGPSQNDDIDIASIKKRITEEPASFSDFIRLTPYLQNGIPVGYRVSPGKDPSLFKQVGLKEGDIVTELNGYTLSDTSQALEAVGLLNSATSLSIQVLRNEQRIPLSIEIPRD
jgi:general secretion pathway protein C